MKDVFKKYEKEIKSTSSFGWTPKYEISVRTRLNNYTFPVVARKTFNDLGWKVIFIDDTTVIAIRRSDLQFETEKVSVTYEYGKVKILSQSLGNEIWDNGRNNKRVELFSYAFKFNEESLSADELRDIEKEEKSKRNWDDYVIPEELPQPKKRRSSKYWVSIFGSLTISILLGLLISLISINGYYYVGVVEVLSGFVLGYLLLEVIKISNERSHDKNHYLVMVSVLVIYISNQFFQYYIISHSNDLDLSFIEFMKLRFEQGFKIDNLNLGWIGFLLSWGLQFYFTFLVAEYIIFNSILKSELAKIPSDVTDLVYFYHIRGKSEYEIRQELTKYGWVKKEDQDDVFNSIHLILEIKDLQKE